MIDLGRIDRFAEAVALHRMHAGGAQEQMLVGGLDALGRHLHAEPAAEADDGMNDRRGIGGLLDRADETGIDLELVEWKTPQIEQTRITSAEIIERKAHTAAFELQHREFRILEIAEQSAFGEFEFKPIGLESGLADDAFDRLDEVRTAELQGRHIDRDREPRPIAAIETGPAQDVFAKLDDQAGMLGNRNKTRRRNFTNHHVSEFDQWDVVGDRLLVIELADANGARKGEALTVADENVD